MEPCFTEVKVLEKCVVEVLYVIMVDCITSFFKVKGLQKYTREKQKRLRQRKKSQYNKAAQCIFVRCMWHYTDFSALIQNYSWLLFNYGSINYNLILMENGCSHIFSIYYYLLFTTHIYEGIISLSLAKRHNNN